MRSASTATQRASGAAVAELLLRLGELGGRSALGERLQARFVGTRRAADDGGADDAYEEAAHDAACTSHACDADAAAELSNLEASIVTMVESLITVRESQKRVSELKKNRMFGKRPREGRREQRWQYPPEDA